MFSSLLFLILTLLIVNLAPEATATVWSGSPWEGFLRGVFLYLALLLLIAAQNKLLLNRGKRLKGAVLLLVNSELLLFFALFHFLFLGHRFYADANDPQAFNTLLSLVSLGLYFIGLGVFHYSGHRPLRTATLPLSRWDYTKMQLRFLFPFTIPFLAFELLFDLLEVIPSETIANALSGEGDPTIQWLFFCSILLFFIGGMLLFLPPVIQFFWGCEMLEDSSLKHRLDELCKRANFRHGGLKIWTVMNHSITAAIIGILPRFRYVMFTEGLLRQMPPEQIEAILAHEIGHSQKKHLLIYPFVILGMVIVTSLFTLLFGDALFEFITLRKLTSPDSLWVGIAPMALFLPFAIIAILYFRIIFGFFSRNFERQADLHVFDLKVHPEHLIGALHGVAVATGGTHNVPNWHHYSIQQRIDYLNSCLKDPSKVKRHHRRVKRILRLYLFLLFSSIALLISIQFPSLPTTKALSQISSSIQDRVNKKERGEIAKEIILRYELPGNQKKISTVIQNNLRDYTVGHIPGVLEFYSAEELSLSGEIEASLILMEAAWRRFDFQKSPDAMEDFDAISRQIITQALEKERGYANINSLIRVMMEAKESQSEERKSQLVE